MTSLGIIDYGAGNLASVCNSFRAIGIEGKLVRSPQDAEGLTHLVLPGVGAFGDCAEALKKQGLDATIRTWIQQDKPFLGICIGYQILFDSSEETPGVAGLGVFRGHVRRFRTKDIKIPHMGWNTVHPTNPAAPIWRGMGENPHFYYVHSYYPALCPDTVATTRHGDCLFSAALKYENFYATQFHPEKSGEVGERILRNFLSL